MKDLDQYTDLADFISELEVDCTQHIPFKIFGKKRKPNGTNKGVFHSASMLGQSYKNIGDPESIAPGNASINAPFGKIYSRGCRLFVGDKSYCDQVNANGTGVNQFQGDIFEYNKNIEGIPTHSCSMILTHSCGVAQLDRVQVIPIFLESELNGALVNLLKGNPTTQPMNVLNNWFSNENGKFVGFPQTHYFNVKGDRLLGSLTHIYSVNKSEIPNAPILRLTFRALSYLQMRVSHFFFRDVQDSDESRNI